MIFGMTTFTFVHVVVSLVGIGSGLVVLAGLLNTQTEAVIAAYDALGLKLRDRGSGEWPVLQFSF